MLFNTVDEHESAGKYLVKNVAYCELKKNLFRDLGISKDFRDFNGI